MTFSKNIHSNIFLSGIVLLLTMSGSCAKKPGSLWRTATIEKGDLTIEVTSSGTLNPHSLVQVGTQVSGTIEKIFVDYNSKVRRGQLVALLDTTFLHAAVEDARAALMKAQSQEVLTKTNADRTKMLLDKGLAAQADLDQAVADRESAKAAARSAASQVDRAKINLAYASIVSPISGVVVNRNVDVGQTVAASFNTPTLFTIADDLSKMQVQASVDEADIGKIKVGQKTKFTVDAYPDRTFEGEISQIRLQPITVQNVVSYTVMVDVDNPDLVLMPGMTANITVTVQGVRGVLKVPSAALKFVPAGAKAGVRGNGSHKGDDSASKGGRLSTRPSDSTSLHSLVNGGWNKGDSSGGAMRHHRFGDSTSVLFNGNDSTGVRKSRGRIYILVNDKPVMVPVKVGLSNGGFTAVEGNIQEGQAVIVGSLSQVGAKTTQQSSPFGMQGPPGGGMGRMR
jgi:HlyD family secretion protein